MNIDLLSRIRRAFSTPRRHQTQEMDPKRPSRSKASRSKSAGTLNFDDGSQQELAEVHKTPKKDEGTTTEALLLDRELLENLVWRLNAELGRYETRMRALDGQGDVPEGSKSAPAWRRADPTTLGPLLSAYDEALSEKETLIEKQERRLLEMGAELREVIHENERLHEALEEIQNETFHERTEKELASKDVESLHSENVALLGRLEDYKTRVEELEEHLMSQRDSELKANEEMAQQQAQMKALARDYRMLQDKLDEASREIENRVPIQHHQSSINECKHLLEELRINYDKDRKLLEDRLSSMTREKVDAESRARAALSEASHNEAKARALEKLLRKAESRSERLQTKLVAAESCRDSSVRELKQLMAVAEKLTVDQENLVRMVASKRYCCSESPIIETHRSKKNQNKHK